VADREQEVAGSAGRAGHQSVPHTADLRVEAWAASREECLAQAVHAVVEAFVDVGAVDPGAPGVTRRGEAVIRGENDADLLVALLDEVVYRLDTEGEVPVDLRLVAVPGGVRARFAWTPVDALPAVGAVPKAVTFQGLSFGPSPEGFRCAVTLDV
jgi:SHS2 domain-containing protein